MMRDIPIRRKLFLLLLSFPIMAIGFFIINSLFEERKQSIRVLSDQLSKLEVDVLHATQAQNNFIIHEPINANFFESGESVYANEYDSITSVINKKLETLAKNEWIIKLKMNDDFNAFSKSLNNYNTTFGKLTSSVYLRGYKDYGLEGRMRVFAHQLENEFIPYIDRADLLMLRRHEKDFIIRREEKYILRFEYQIELIKYKILINNKIHQAKKDEIEDLLNTYEEIFKELILVEKKIGLKEAKGLKKQVDLNAHQFIADINKMKGEVELAQTELLSGLRWQYAVFFIVFLTITFLISLKISHNMSSRIKKLKNNLNEFVMSNFKETSEYTAIAGKDEIGQLAKNIKLLEDEIVVHFGLYRKKVERRTQEILAQKEKLEVTRDIIQRKNKDILSSIRYAKKIQDSILPENRYLDQLLSEYFVLYNPKDIVSGDFYWVERTNEKVFVAVADCTGHGVPGAFMSIMGHNFLNQAINEKGLSCPDQILNYMNIAISSSLGQNNHNYRINGTTMATQTTKVQDGMDIALIALDYSKNELMFSAAQRPLILARNGEIIEYKGDRFPVGGSTYGEIKKFSQKTIELKSGDCIYLFSDGYADQFGGPNHKKFKKSKLRELLKSIQNESVEVQKEIMNDSFEVWKGNKDQIDDICVFGIKI